MKSISFMIMVFLFGISVIACKESKPAEEAAVSTGELTSDSLKAIREAMIQSLTQMNTMLDQQITYTETALSTASEEAKAQLTLTLEQLKKQKANIESGVTKVQSATDASWASITQEMETVFTDAKAAIRGEAASAGEFKKPGTSPETPTGDMKK